MAGRGQAELKRTGGLQAYWRSLVLVIAALTAAGSSYWLFTSTNAEPSVQFDGSMGVFTNSTETSAALYAWFLPGDDRIFLFVEADHLGSGRADFVLLLAGQAKLSDTRTNGHDGLRVTVPDMPDEDYQLFSFTLTEDFNHGFVEVTGLPRGKVTDSRGGATVIELPSMGTRHTLALLEWPPLKEIDPPFELPAFPGQTWAPPRDSKNLAFAGDVEIDTTIDLVRPPLDPNYPAQLIWSGSTLIEPQAHLTNYVAQRRQQSLLFAAGVLAGLATSLLVEALVLRPVRRATGAAELTESILSVLRRRNR